MRKIKFIAWTIVVLFIASFLGINMLKVIKPGYSAAVEEAGYVRQKSYRNGIVVITPFVGKVIPFNVREQVYQFSYETRSSSLQKITVPGAVNYSLNPDNVHRLYQAVTAEDGTYQKIIFAPYIEGSLNQLIGKQSFEFITVNQDMVNEAMNHILAKEISPELVQMRKFQLFCPKFDDKIEEAILAKTVAQQETEKVKEEAKQMLLRAEAEGKKIELTSQSLKNPLIVQYEVAKALGKWQGNLPTTLIIGSDALPILNGTK